MEGGMTRRKGYAWLTAALAAVLLLLLLWPHRESPTTLPSAGDTLGLPPVAVTAAPVSTKSYHRWETSPSARQREAVRPTGESRYSEVAQPREAVASRAYPRESRRTRVDLNGGDTLDFQQLYNIGPLFARRIVNYRTALGGFVDKRQLMEVYGMDSVRYVDIAPYITLDSAGVRQLDINSATIDQLKKHPYLDYYQAKAIVRLREKEGLYRTIDDLKKVPLIDQETYNKLSPYITCNLLPSK